MREYLTCRCFVSDDLEYILWVLCIDFAFIYDLSPLWCLFLQAVARNSETPQQSEEKGGDKGIQGAKNQVIARFTVNAKKNQLLLGLQLMLEK